MTPIQQLPNRPLDQNFPISQLFLQHKLKSFHDACGFVWELPYGRTSNNSDYQTVMYEQRGTCSSKHALLKALADELAIPLELTLGIYAMSEHNTPGVGQVLETTEFDYIPEAHCYLTYRGQRIDLTKYGVTTDQSIDSFFKEHTISPDQIGDHKKQLHKAFIKQHFPHIPVDKVWLTREQCILALYE